MTTTDPAVSVVIPTLGRPSLKGAVDSVLGQSSPPFEVVIGADTDEPLDLPEDERVVVVRCGPRGGGNAARAAAIRRAQGQFVALLDDDDQWQGHKLEVQLARIDEEGLSPDRPWVLSSRVVDTDGTLRPVKLISPGEHPLGYLFEKRGIRRGLGKFHTSTLIAPRWLFDEVPFNPAVKFNQDMTWYIQLLERFPETVFLHCPEPLATVRRPEVMLVDGETTGSVSAGIQWRESAQWISTYMSDLEPRWRGDYALTDQLVRAMLSSERSEHLRAFVAGFRGGRPGFWAVAYALAKLAQYNLKNLRYRVGGSVN